MRTGYDDIVAQNVPPGGGIYLGYDDGSWPDAPAIAARFPNTPVIRCTVNPNDDEGDMLDVERGDAMPADAPGWIERRRRDGHPNPMAYTSAGQGPNSPGAWQDLRRAFQVAGVAEPQYGIADYDNNPSIPANWLAAGCIGKQWQSYPTYDIWTFVDSIVGIDARPTPTQEAGVEKSVDPKTGTIALVDPAGEVFCFNANGTPGGHYLGGLNNHPDWNAGDGKANGPAVSINHYDDGNLKLSAYVIITRDSAGGFHWYDFPSDGRYAK